jgi:NADH-quinone oxidoreductase subunit N
MNAPVVWILFPGIVAMVLFLLRRWERSIHIAGILIAIALAWLAMNLPINERISLAPLPSPSTFTVGETLTILGRRFVLQNDSRPLLALVYLVIAFWFGGAYVAKTSRLFVPAGLGIAALLIAVLAVEPFLYAALLIEVAALASVPILSPPGKPVGRGVLRFLTFQTFGVPFILFAGWMLSGVGTTPEDADLILRVSVLIILGFAFFMAIFPFHTWIPMLAGEEHPYSTAFVFFFIPGIISLFGLEFLNQYNWLRALPWLYLVLGSLGTLMVTIGGIWAAFQRHLGRIFGYAVILEIGLILQALSLLSNVGSEQTGAPPITALSVDPQVGIYFGLFLPRALGFALWALALSVLKAQTGDLSFDQVEGYGRRYPWVATALTLALLSLAGFPLLAGFPVHLSLWSAVVQESLPFTALSLAGAAGLIAAGVRTLAVLISGYEPMNWSITETRAQIILLGLGCAMLIIAGLFPQWYLPALTRIVQSFLGSPAP